MASKNGVNGLVDSAGNSTPNSLGAGGVGAGGGSGGGDDILRWTAGRKAAVVLDIVKGKTTPADVARQYDLTVSEVDTWVEKFLESGREGLRAVPRDLEARFDSERKDLLAKVGELTLQVDALKKGTRSAATLTAISGQATNW